MLRGGDAAASPFVSPAMRDSRQVPTLIFLLAAAAATALSLHAAITGGLLPFDRAIADELQLVPGGRFYEPPANLLALGVVEYALLFTAGAIAWRANDRALAVAVLFILAARTLNLPMKELIARPRPDETDMLIRDPADGWGFPSGHASTVVLVYGYVAIVAARHLPRRWAIPIVAVVVLSVLLIGWDRVYDGAHWPSDVLGGWTAGLALLIIAVTLPHVAPVRRCGAGIVGVGQRMTGGLRWTHGDRATSGARQSQPDRGVPGLERRGPGGDHGGPVPR